MRKYEETYKFDWLDRQEQALKALGFDVIRMLKSGHAVVRDINGATRTIPV